MSRPYKRGSHGERGVPTTSRVFATQGFMTLDGSQFAKGLDPRVVRSMHCLLGKGYAGGGGRFALQAQVVFAVASSECSTQVGRE